MNKEKFVVPVDMFSLTRQMEAAKETLDKMPPAKRLPKMSAKQVAKERRFLDKEITKQLSSGLIHKGRDREDRMSCVINTLRHIDKQSSSKERREFRIDPLFMRYVHELGVFSSEIQIFEDILSCVEYIRHVNSMNGADVGFVEKFMVGIAVEQLQNKLNVLNLKFNFRYYAPAPTKEMIRREALSLVPVIEITAPKKTSKRKKKAK
jgi:hypothetical protein